MHPDRRFRWDDIDAMRAFVRQRGFATLFMTGADGPRAAYVPIVVDGDRLSFHLSRGNSLAGHVAGQTLLCSVVGSDSYISPDWYESGPDAVPTWNYAAVEMEGQARALDEAELTAQLVALSAQSEAMLAPKRPWTLDKASPDYVAKLSRAIIGFEMAIDVWRGVRKASQNKPEAVRGRVVTALEQLGDHAGAQLVQTAGQ